MGRHSCDAGAKEATSDGKKKSVLDNLLGGLAPVAMQAQQELPQNATEKDIAAHAVKVNVLSNMKRLVEVSDTIREKVRSGEVQIHGGIYDLDSGEVTFLGQLSKEQLSAVPRNDKLFGA